MTMDNLQRTEHFLSYCPQLINVSETLPQKEAIKRLSNLNIIFFKYSILIIIYFKKAIQKFL
jgi:hypothetical protein